MIREFTDNGAAASSPLKTETPGVRLRGQIGVFQYFALGFGTMIGSAWIVLLGGWLSTAGPGGTVLGFLAGGLVMMIVGSCYAELIAHAPEAGTEFIYAYRLFGPLAGFIVGWFLFFYPLSVAVYEGLALPWVIEVLVPQLGHTTLYTAFGTAISTSALGIGMGVLLLLVLINLFGVKSAVRFHSVMTFGFIAVAVVVIAVMITFGRPANALPVFGTTDGRPWWHGAWYVFAFSGSALTGFQAIPHMIEERSKVVPLAAIKKVMVISIGAAALFYSVVVVAVSVAAPWKISVHGSIAPATAVSTLPGGRFLAVTLLCATVVSLMKAWNGVFMMAVRLLIAMSRTGLLPARLGQLDSRGHSPRAAILVVGMLNLAGLFLGRGAIIPLVGMCIMVLTCIYFVGCIVVLGLRRRERQSNAASGNKDILVMVAAVGAFLMAAVSLISPFWRGDPGLPMEWCLLLTWAGVALVFWFSFARFRAHGGRGSHRLPV